MNIEKIKCFVDIVKFNSFTKAAQENYVTQAAISQQISSMEAELGFQLFERSKRGFTVTPRRKELLRQQPAPAVSVQSLSFQGKMHF